MRSCKGTGSLGDPVSLDGGRRAATAVVAPAGGLVKDDSETIGDITDGDRGRQQELVVVEAVVRDSDERRVVTAVGPAPHRSIRKRCIAEADDTFTGRE